MAKGSDFLQGLAAGIQGFTSTYFPTRQRYEEIGREERRWQQQYQLQKQGVEFERRRLQNEEAKVKKEDERREQFKQTYGYYPEEVPAQSLKDTREEKGKLEAAYKTLSAQFPDFFPPGMNIEVALKYQDFLVNRAQIASSEATRNAAGAAQNLAQQRFNQQQMEDKVNGLGRRVESLRANLKMYIDAGRKPPEDAIAEYNKAINEYNVFSQVLSGIPVGDVLSQPDTGAFMKQADPATRFDLLKTALAWVDKREAAGENVGDAYRQIDQYVVDAMADAGMPIGGAPMQPTVIPGKPQQGQPQQGPQSKTGALPGRAAVPLGQRPSIVGPTPSLLTPDDKAALAALGSIGKAVEETTPFGGSQPRKGAEAAAAELGTLRGQVAQRAIDRLLGKEKKGTSPAGPRIPGAPAPAAPTFDEARAIAVMRDTDNIQKFNKQYNTDIVKRLEANDIAPEDAVKALEDFKNGLPVTLPSGGLGKEGIFQRNMAQNAATVLGTLRYIAKGPQGAYDALQAGIKLTPERSRESWGAPYIWGSPY